MLAFKWSSAPDRSFHPVVGGGAVIGSNLGLCWRWGWLILFISSSSFLFQKYILIFHPMRPSHDIWGGPGRRSLGQSQSLLYKILPWSRIMPGLLFASGIFEMNVAQLRLNLDQWIPELNISVFLPFHQSSPIILYHPIMHAQII